MAAIPELLIWLDLLISSISNTCRSGGKTILLNELMGLKLGDCSGVVNGVLDGEVMLNMGW